MDGCQGQRCDRGVQMTPEHPTPQTRRDVAFCLLAQKWLNASALHALAASRLSRPRIIRESQKSHKGINQPYFVTTSWPDPRTNNTAPRPSVIAST